MLLHDRRTPRRCRARPAQVSDGMRSCRCRGRARRTRAASSQSRSSPSSRPTSSAMSVIHARARRCRRRSPRARSRAPRRSRRTSLERWRSRGGLDRELRLMRETGEQRGGGAHRRSRSPIMAVSAPARPLRGARGDERPRHRSAGTPFDLRRPAPLEQERLGRLQPLRARSAASAPQLVGSPPNQARAQVWGRSSLLDPERMRARCRARAPLPRRSGRAPSRAIGGRQLATRVEQRVRDLGGLELAASRAAPFERDRCLVREGREQAQLLLGG